MGTQRKKQLILQLVGVGKGSQDWTGASRDKGKKSFWRQIALKKERKAFFQGTWGLSHSYGRVWAKGKKKE